MSLFLLMFTLGLVHLGGQTVSVTSPAGCFAATFVFSYDASNSPDATGRNVYYYSNSGLEIRYNSGANRWEIRARGGNFDIYYVNTFASSPNPPDNNTSAWGDFGFCDNTGAATVTGSGTQSTIGGDPCAGLGGDSDGDGACDDNDICPGFNDFTDQDFDGIPDGCDANPTVPDGVLVNASCLDPDPILFTFSGTDGTGRNIYSTTFANGLQVRYNSTSNRWEVRAAAGAMDVYLFNNFASWPDPPGSAGTWSGTSVLNCNTAPTPAVSGSGTQNTLGCAISLGTPSITQPTCGGDGAIFITATGAKGAVTYSLRQGVTTLSSNGTGAFGSLDAGTYTILAVDGAFPPNVCSTQTSSITLVVQDNIAPSASDPAPTNVTCLSEVPDVNTAVVIDEADNCGIPTVTYEGQTSSGIGNQASPLVILRSYRVTDAAGNLVIVFHTITVTKNVAPSITCPADVTKECDESTSPANTGLATATDNCDPTLSPTFSDMVAPGACPQAFTITRTWTATDDCSNSSSCVQIITIDDSTPPIITCPADKTIECDESTFPANTGLATAIDNCDPTLTPTFSDIVAPGACPQAFTITRTWTATDDCSNSSSCVQIITIDDSTPPVITGPAHKTIECDESTDIGYTGDASAVDNCDPTTSIGHSDEIVNLVGENYTILRTWTATDNCGNASSLVQTITVEDTKPPIFSSCPGSQSVSTDPGLCTAVVTYSSPVATDNCAAPVITLTEGLPSASAFPLGTTVVNYQATDANANSTNCTFAVTVIDNEAPSIDCPSTINLSIANTCQVPLPDLAGEAMINDNCTAAIDLQITQDPVPGTLIGPGITLTTLTVRDAAGNEDVCTVEVVVLAGTSTIASLSCPGDIYRLAECETGQAEVTLPVPGFPKICVPTTFQFRYRTVNPANTPVGSFTAFQPLVSNTRSFGVGRYEIEWQVSDEFGTLNCHYYLQVDSQVPQVPTIVGVRNLCQDLNNIPYSVPMQNGVSEYQWSYSGIGATIKQNGTSAVLLDFADNAASGQLTVKVIDPCGNADALATINIEIGNLATCVFINCLLSDLLVSDNTLLLSGMPRVFKVAKQITSYATIQNPETVIFKSGNSIELQSGFKVNQGAVFVAEIEGCTITFPSAGGD